MSSSTRGGRYCLVTDGFPDADGARGGGTATYADLVVRTLLDEGWQVTVVLLDEYSTRITQLPDPYLPVELWQVGIRDESRLTGRRPGVRGGWRLGGALRALDRRSRFDVIEGMNYEGYLWRAALQFGDRFWLRCHTSVRQHIDAKGEALTSRKRWRIWLDGFAARRAAHLITHSTFHAEQLRTEYHLGDRAIAVLPHATPHRPRVTSRGEARYVGYLGGLNARKGADLFVDMIPRVAAAAPHLEFVMIGADPSGQITARAQALKAAEPAWGERLHVTGQIDEAALEAWWARLDLLIVPSRYESFGLTVIEAFSRGVPVLCSDAGALLEVAGDAAAVFPSGNADALVERVLALARHDVERRRLSDLGWQRYQARYSMSGYRKAFHDMVLAPASHGGIRR